MTIALAFGALFWWYLDGTVGPDVARARALEYFTGYLIEKSLAVDNVFVWITLFNFFAVPAALQKRVLLYGVLGAIVKGEGDTVKINVKLITPVAMEDKMRFAIREGGKTVGAGVVTKIIK